jgi:hypothetical protein
MFDNPILPFHLAAMAASCLAMLVAISAARFFKSRKWWLKTHKALNISSIALLAVGLALAIAMTEAAGESAIGAPHRVLGFVSIGLGAFLVLVGFSIFRLQGKGKEAIAARKKLHRYLGRAEAVSMLATISLGFVAALLR